MISKFDMPCMLCLLCMLWFILQTKLQVWCRAECLSWSALNGMLVLKHLVRLPKSAMDESNLDKLCPYVTMSEQGEAALCDQMIDL